MYKRVCAIIFSCLLFNLLCLITEINTRQTFSTTNPTGYTIVKVLEDGSLAPINNATICIVETRSYYQTNKYGYTEKIPVPIISNKNFDISLKREYGEFTLIVYAPGYSTLISYYNSVYAGMTNAGIVCKLPLVINQSDENFVVFSNKPSDEYSAQLINLYKK